MPDFISHIQAKTSLSKSTVAAILLKSGRLQDALNNPQAFIEQVTGAINDCKQALLVDGVEYVKVDGAWRIKRTGYTAVFHEEWKRSDTPSLRLATP